MSEEKRESRRNMRSNKDKGEMCRKDKDQMCGWEGGRCGGARGQGQGKVEKGEKCLRWGGKTTAKSKRCLYPAAPDACPGDESRVPGSRLMASYSTGIW